jgi:hypothetical protein
MIFIILWEEWRLNGEGYFMRDIGCGYLIFPNSAPVGPYSMKGKAFIILPELYKAEVKGPQNRVKREENT